MTPLIKNTWKLLKKQYKEISKYDNSIVFAEEKYESFHTNFIETYNCIKDKYMSKAVKNLDRHKVAALLIICILRDDIITYKSNDTHNNSFTDTKDVEKDIFIGAELFALKAGLSYMIEKLNENLSAKSVGKKIDVFELPHALSCETPYIEVLCRNLYFAKRDYTLNPIELSEKLFLLEYICLLKHGIEPEILKEFETPTLNNEDTAN